MSEQLGDKRNPTYWRAIKPESTLTLTDDQALRESISGEEYFVSQVIKICEKDGICEWIFFELAGQGDTPDAWLMAKLVDQEVDIRVFFESESFNPGNREDMIQQDNMFLFQKPEDPDDFEYDDLAYAKHIGWDFSAAEASDDEDGDDIHVDYNVKIGELQGDVSYDPHQLGETELLATVVEFDTSDETTCPELLILEIGHPENDEGGLIRLLFGNRIKPTEVEVLAVTSA